MSNEINEALGVMRSFIQQRARNGDTVVWGSLDQVDFRDSLTVRDLEDLAIKIANRISETKEP